MAASVLVIPAVYLTVLLVTTELIGDYFLGVILLKVGLNNRLIAALDTVLIHGSVAGISQLIVTRSTTATWKTTSNHGGLPDTLLSIVFGILIDVDHFIAARSFQLKNAMELKQRPAFHSTSLLLVTVISLVLLSTTSNQLFVLLRVASILLVAGLSHHLRDATRRGLWFPPFGSTAPLPYWTYLAATAALPNCISRLTMAVTFHDSPGHHQPNIVFGV